MERRGIITSIPAVFNFVAGPFGGALMLAFYLRQEMFMDANHPSHYVGRNVGNGDQLSSVTLLALALAGSVVVVFANWIVFG